MPTESAVRCKRCTSEKQEVFSSEVAIHFRGLEGLGKPIVWAFPKIRVCLECGVAEFTVPTRELQVLATGHPIEGALVSLTRQEQRTD